MLKKILIFDFDGTIADTHKYIVEISNRLSSKYHYDPIDLNELEDLKNKTSQEIIRYLKVPIMKIPTILAQAKKEFYKEIAKLKPFEGQAELLNDLKQAGITMGILSSNALENIKTFLNNNGLDIFDFIHSTSKVWSKNTSLKRLIKEKGFNVEDVLYVGDEIRDIIAARRLGVKIAAVTWGYNSMEALKRHDPDYIIETPQQLYDLCTNFK